MSQFPHADNVVKAEMRQAPRQKSLYSKVDMATVPPLGCAEELHLHCIRALLIRKAGHSRVLPPQTQS